MENSTNVCGSQADLCNTCEAKTQELNNQEKALLSKFGAGLKWEKAAWLIGGIASLVSIAYMLIGAFLLPICGMDAYSPETAHEFTAITVFCLSLAVCVLPIAIVSFTMMKKTGRYRAKLFTDCTDAICHYSVGSIILAALFNEIALVFVIINFVRAKCNADRIEQIKAKQAYN